jgi:hypothetical protein
MSSTAKLHRFDPQALATARRNELWPRPLGSLGRRLLPEVEAYLGFFTIARG